MDSFFVAHTTFAQYEAVVFDYEKAYFNNGQPLPAESYIMFSGSIDNNIHWVEVNIYKAKASKPLYQVYWKRTSNDRTESFQLFVKFTGLDFNSRLPCQVSRFAGSLHWRPFFQHCCFL